MTTPILPSSSIGGWKYDVFLSFRGEDTRNSFVNHLYSSLVRAGIHTFQDGTGVEASSNLLDVIQGSRICIVVLSENYACSTWCLDELVKILDCKKTKGCILFPIFYHVHPSDIRRQTGTFAEAFARHEKRFGKDSEPVQQWREALEEVANISGFTNRNANGSESMLVEEVVFKVLDVMSAVHSNVAMHPRIEDSRVEEIKTLLNLGTSDVRMVGIYGIGGIGKTTLARAVYNQVRGEFEGCSFLSNIREISKDPNGLAHLQEQLLSNILGMKNLKIYNVDDGINLIKEKLNRKRLVVVLDDVDQWTQLEALAGSSKWFGMGSRVILTSKDGYLLTDIGVNAKYKVEEFTFLEFLKRFSQHTSNIYPPIEDHHELSIGASILVEAASNQHYGWDLKSAADGRESNLITSQNLPSFSKSYPNHWDHDVFLSFGGENIRKTFLSHLKSALEQAGIDVCLDSKNLQRGENIPARLHEAIHRPRISIVVFSKDYFFSKRCLDELVDILHCAKTIRDQSLLPIFHDVKPTHVRHQTGVFGEAFDGHKEKFKADVERVQRWRKTLADAADYSGLDLESDANGNQAKLVEKVVEDVLCKVNVGVLESSTKIKALLKLGTTEVRTVGIYGKVGIGKTTLAKTIYKQIHNGFDGRCLLLNIKETSKQPDGLVCLQKKLLSGILKEEINLKIDNIHQGINLIKKRLGDKRVLIILDGVDHMKQLHALAGNSKWLCPGSRIIITTRDERLLTLLRVHEKFEVEELNYWESFELFNRYAFGMVGAREGYLELSICAVEHAGGVPLALKELGSFLRGRSIGVWTRVLEYFDKISPQSGDPENT